MSKIYLVNVGANNAHKSTARSPLFADGKFRFVTYPQDSDAWAKPYPPMSLPYVRGKGLLTHLDPDWDAKTYGDCCHNPRALALRNAAENDIFLFWSLLWKKEELEDIWKIGGSMRRWCLIGALRIREILKPGQSAKDVKPSRAERAKQNMHFYRKNNLDDGHYVFIGCTKHSTLFSKAVDLGVKEADGILYRTILSAKEEKLSLGGKPQWNSSLRGCRVVWDLSVPTQQKRAKIVRDKIQDDTGFDILAGI